MKSCSGLYADVWSDKTERANFEDKQKLQKLEEEYGRYKSKFAENLIFDPDAPNYGRSFYRVFFLTAHPLNLLSVGW